MTYLLTLPSPIGPLTAASDGEHLVGLWMEGQQYFMSSVKDEEIIRCELPQNESESSCLIPLFDSVRQWLDRYFSGQRPDPRELPLAPHGSTFRHVVWKHLLDIPYGTTISYGELSRRIARSLNKPHMSAQAIGGAVGHNPISIIIPCHRVIGADGSLTGYAGGVDRKRWLLELETNTR